MRFVLATMLVSACGTQPQSMTKGLPSEDPVTKIYQEEFVSGNKEVTIRDFSFDCQYRKTIKGSYTTYKTGFRIGSLRNGVLYTDDSDYPLFTRDEDGNWFGISTRSTEEEKYVRIIRQGKDGRGLVIESALKSSGFKDAEDSKALAGYKAIWYAVCL